MIAQSTIDAVFEGVTIDTFRDELPELKKAGSAWKCRSPFTDEKTPSFYVFKQGTRYKDFSSGHGGTYIDLIMRTRGLTFPEAIEHACGVMSIECVRTESPKAQEEIDAEQRLRDCLQLAVDRWETNLHDLPDEHPAWLEVFRRGLTSDHAREYGFGYARDGWSHMTEFLTERGYHAEAVELGILNEKNGKTYDAMRDRLMIPVFDERRRLASFAGRAMNQDDKVKWINGRNTRIFEKGKVLWGWESARQAADKARELFLVEGYFDVTSMHRAGIANTVATGGTALTEAQISMIRRVADRVVIVRDGDDAGTKAALRDFELLLPGGLEVFVAVLPEKMDPDDFVRVHMPSEDVNTLEAVEA